jgi:hypothetical protein
MKFFSGSLTFGCFFSAQDFGDGVSDFSENETEREKPLQCRNRTGRTGLAYGLFIFSSNPNCTDKKEL